MMDKQPSDISERLQTWVREQLDTAVETLSDRNVFGSAIIEVRPAWSLPHRILIGKAREPGSPESFRWFIGGDLQFDHVDSTVADSPRDALRHFAIKWQLDASRADGELAKTLIEQAEAVYPLSEDDRLWET